MEALNHAITLGVVGSGQVVGDAEEAGQLLPQTRSKLAPAISHDGGRDAETRHPVAQEGPGAGLGGDGGQRNRLHPAGEPVHHGEKIGVTLRFWQRAHEVQVDGRKASVGHGQDIERGLGMTGDLGSLAVKASTAKLFDLLGHVPPDKTSLEVAEHRLRARVGH